MKYPAGQMRFRQAIAFLKDTQAFENKIVRDLACVCHNVPDGLNFRVVAVLPQFTDWTGEA